MKELDTDSFYSKEVRAAFRLSPSSLGRYLYELERMGYIKIARGNRYKGYEYKIQSWNDLENLASDAQSMVKSILENIKLVTRIPPVPQSLNGLHKIQQISAKDAVTHD